MSSVLESMYNVSFNVLRSTIVSDTATNALTTAASAVAGVMRPVRDRAQLYNDANFGKEYRLHCAKTVDIKSNDVVSINSTLYTVLGVSLFEDIDESVDSHLEIVIAAKQ